jgi:Tetratricopeptide repeat
MRTLPETPAVADSVNTLAILLEMQARYPEAEQLYKRAIAIHETEFGPNHPRLRVWLFNLATLYRRRPTSYREAEQPAVPSARQTVE